MNSLKGNTHSFKKAIHYVGLEIKGQLEHDLRQIPTLAGSPGIGKTASLVALGEELGYKTFVYQLSAVSPEEFSGIPDFEELPSSLVANWSVVGATAGKLTRWSVPEIVANVNRAAEKQNVFVIFDDIHMADPALERYLFNLFLDKVVGQYKLADNVAVAAAMNDTEEAGFQGFNAAILDRLSLYKVTFDFDYWYNIIGSQLHPLIASFLRAYSREKSIIVSTSSNTDERGPSPRSWTELSKFITYLEKNSVTRWREDLKTIASSRIGDAATAQLIKFSTIFFEYNFEEMLANNKIKPLDPNDPIDSILMALIVRFIKTKKHAQLLYDYVVKTVEDNLSFTPYLLTETQSLAIAAKKQKVFDKLHGLKHFISLVTKSDIDEVKKAFSTAFL